ncbi:PiggyBac transposable element-derived protein 4 [Elysia marginata]|uniref:PiggyBac transposable element-derived protein 4 n=1 Tax=Elysia marginata TaxID=1093978 RepID=A0AAV4JWI6_9GAST|nr:PiggyBac transposable element-derived protein 4 [Elysia marginata]
MPTFCASCLKHDRKKYKGLKIFKLHLVDELCEVAATLAPDPTQQVATKPGRPRTSNPVERLEGCNHIIVWTPDDRRCKVCSKPDAPKKTNFRCEGCENKPPLHPKHCFKVWHTQLHFLS